MGGTSRTSTSVAPRSPPAAVIFDIGGTILEERWYDLQAALRAVVPDTRLADDLSVEFQRLVSEQHRANREVALAGWLLARLPEIIFTLEELEDELWRHVVELVPFAGVSDSLAQIAADRNPCRGHQQRALLCSSPRWRTRSIRSLEPLSLRHFQCRPWAAQACPHHLRDRSPPAGHRGGQGLVRRRYARTGHRRR